MKPFMVHGVLPGAARVAALLFAMLGAAGAAGAPPDAEIVSLEGIGEYREAQQPAWSKAKLKQALAAGNFVRTGDLSRMGLLFSDRTQIRLNQNSMLQIREISKADGKPTVLDLKAGRSWVQSKTLPKGLVMNTPSAVAAIRGTDWEMDVAPDGTATLTVLSGEVEFANDHGRVVVGRDEQARAEVGKAPVKLVIRNPRDRIQWVSSLRVDPRRYAELRDPQSPDSKALAPVLAALRDGDMAAAYALLSKSAEARPAAVSRLLLADFEAYRGEFERSARMLAQDQSRFPADERFETARARLALVDGRGDEARRLATAALARNPKSANALVVLGDVERFDGRRAEAVKAYREAAAIAAGDPAPWLGLGIAENARGNAGPALEHLAKAASLDPASATAQAELGAARATAQEPGLAREAYRRALELSPDDYLALTGLGALELSQGNQDEGLDLLLRANLVEPRHARAHLWLAAAYYRMGRTDAALESLSRASAADPKDPVPHLFASLIEQDRLQPADALAQARQAQAKMPFLKSLDEVADNQKGIANVGSALAALGLEYWARQAAQESYLPFWGGSHLFLADRYPGEYNRRSELVQGFVTDPLSFGASNRFQSLYRAPGLYGTLSYRYNRDSDISVREPVVTVNGSTAGSAPAAWFLEAIDTRVEPGDTAFDARARTYTAGFGIRPTHRMSLFAYLNRLTVDADIGRAGETGDFLRIEGTVDRIDAGMRYAPDADNSLWLKAGASREDSTVDQRTTVLLPDYTLVRDSGFATKPERSDLQVRQTIVWKPGLELTWGAVGARMKEPRTLVQDSGFRFPAAAGTPESLDGRDEDRHDAVHARVRADVDGWRVEAALGYSQYRKDRDFLVTPAGGDPIPIAESYRERRPEGEIGVVRPLAPGALARGACRQWVRGVAFDTILPVAGSGVPLDDQLVLAGGRERQCRAQLEWTAADRAFGSAFVEALRVENLTSPLDGPLNSRTDVSNIERLRNRVLLPPPLPDRLEDTPVYGEGKLARAGVALEGVAARWLSLRADYTYAESENTGPAWAGNPIPYVPRHRFNLGATWTPGHRVYVTAQAAWRSIRYRDEAAQAEVPAGWDARVDAFVESADKRWSVEVYGANLLRKQVSDLYGVVVSLRF
jgi:tetratricopeptide (TPR) repeat protein